MTVFFYVDVTFIIVIVGFCKLKVFVLTHQFIYLFANKANVSLFSIYLSSFYSSLLLFEYLSLRVVGLDFFPILLAEPGT